jgi:hypothetical protein
LVHREVNGNILMFLSAKDLFRFKSVSKSAKSTVKSEKGLIFNAIGECSTPVPVMVGMKG